MMYNEEAKDVRAGTDSGPAVVAAELAAPGGVQGCHLLTPRDKNNMIVNTHATFRWRHGLFSAFDFDQIRLLEPDLFICLVDNIEVVHHRLHDEHDIDATLKDCMVWREEEILATELMSQAIPGFASSTSSAAGGHEPTTRTRSACFAGRR
jgi:hypothetical protein